MKKNLHSAKGFVAIVTSISKTIAFAIICFAFAKSNATNIDATLAAPAKFGGCIAWFDSYKDKIAVLQY